MNIALVGLGDIATKAYLPILCTRADVQPWLCTRNTQTLERLTQQYRAARVFNNFEEMLQAKPDAVFIHSSTNTHFAMAKASLQAGIATFIDKPISYDFSECEDIVEMARAKGVPLQVGFNRRFAPLYQALPNTQPLHVYYQKNRHHLPDDARTFIYDDFVHVLDTLLWLSKGEVHELTVRPHFEGTQLASLWVNWTANNAIFTAEMNRINAINEEVMQYTGANKKWLIQNLSEGTLVENKQRTPLSFGDWENTLNKRGFIPMLDHVLDVFSQGGASDYDGILATHRLCEIIFQRVQQIAAA